MDKYCFNEISSWRKNHQLHDDDNNVDDVDNNNDHHHRNTQHFTSSYNEVQSSYLKRNSIHDNYQIRNGGHRPNDSDKNNTRIQSDFIVSRFNARNSNEELFSRDRNHTEQFNYDDGFYGTGNRCDAMVIGQRNSVVSSTDRFNIDVTSRRNINDVDERSYDNISRQRINPNRNIQQSIDDRTIPFNNHRRINMVSRYDEDDDMTDIRDRITRHITDDDYDRNRYNDITRELTKDNRYNVDDRSGSLNSIDGFDLGKQRYTGARSTSFNRSDMTVRRYVKDVDEDDDGNHDDDDNGRNTYLNMPRQHINNSRNLQRNIETRNTSFNSIDRFDMDKHCYNDVRKVPYNKNVVTTLRHNDDIRIRYDDTSEQRNILYDTSNKYDDLKRSNVNKISEICQNVRNRLIDNLVNPIHNLREDRTSDKFSESPSRNRYDDLPMNRNNDDRNLPYNKCRVTYDDTMVQNNKYADNNTKKFFDSKWPMGNNLSDDSVTTNSLSFKKTINRGFNSSNNPFRKQHTDGKFSDWFSNSPSGIRDNFSRSFKSVGNNSANEKPKVTNMSTLPTPNNNNRRKPPLDLSLELRELRDFNGNKQLSGAARARYIFHRKHGKGIREAYDLAKLPMKTTKLLYVGEQKSKGENPFKKIKLNNNNKSETEQKNILIATRNEDGKSKIGIIHKNYPDAILSSHDLTTLINKIIYAIPSATRRGILPQFDGFTVKSGCLSVICLCENTLQWLRTFTENYIDSEVIIVRDEETPNEHIITGLFPNEDSSTDVIKNIGAQNPTLMSANWIIIERNRNDSGNILFSIDKQSLDCLKQMNFCINYKLSSITLCLTNCNPDVQK